MVWIEWSLGGESRGGFLGTGGAGFRFMVEIDDATDTRLGVRLSSGICALDSPDRFLLVAEALESSRGEVLFERLLVVGLLASFVPAVS